MATQEPAPPEHLRGPKDQHEKWLLHRIWKRLNRNNEHFMGVIVGQEGSGKSYTAVKIAKAIDPSFNADRVIFNVAELLERLADGNHEMGQCYVLDEAGVQFGVRTWQDRAQVLANQALQLVRKHNLGLIFTLPRLSELDSQAQGRLQAMYNIDEKVNGEYVKGRWKFFDADREDNTGEIYKKYPRRIQNGRKKRITRLQFTPPEGEEVEKYEAKKDEFQREVYEAAIAEGEKEEAEEVAVADIAEKIKDAGSVAPYMSHHGGHNKWVLSKEKLRDSFNLTHRDAKRLKDHLREDPEVNLQAAADEREENTQTNTTQGGYS